MHLCIPFVLVLALVVDAFALHPPCGWFLDCCWLFDEPPFPPAADVPYYADHLDGLHGGVALLLQQPGIQPVFFDDDQHSSECLVFQPIRHSLLIQGEE